MLRRDPESNQARDRFNSFRRRYEMKATQLLHNLGQSLWLDNITRDLLDQRHAQSATSTSCRSRA